MDSSMRKATVRKLLNQAFQIGTGVGQKHGYLTQGSNTATKKGQRRSAKRQADYTHLMDNIFDYETTLSMSRQEPFRVVEIKRGKQSRYYIMPTMRYRLQATVALEDANTKNKEARKRRNPKKSKVRLQDEFSKTRIGRTPSQDLTKSAVIPFQVPLYDPDDIGDEGGFVRENVNPIGYYWDYIVMGPSYIFQGRRSYRSPQKSREQTQQILQGLRNTNFGANSFRMRELLHEDYTNPTIAQTLLDKWNRKVLDIHGPITNDEREAMEAIVRANQIARTISTGYYSQPNYFLAFGLFVKSVEPDMVTGTQVIARRDLLQRFNKAWKSLYDPTRMVKDWNQNLKPRERGSRFEVAYINANDVPTSLANHSTIPADLQFMIPDMDRYYDPENMDKEMQTDTLFGTKITYEALVPKVRTRFARETTKVAYYEPTYLTSNEVDDAMQVAQEQSKEGRRAFINRMNKGGVTSQELFSLTVIQTTKVLRFLIASEAILGREETRFDLGQVLSNPLTQSAWTYCTGQGLSTKYIIPATSRQKKR